LTALGPFAKEIFCGEDDLIALSSDPIEFHDSNAPTGQAFYRVAQQ
jgi:hypothetical protein